MKRYISILLMISIILSACSLKAAASPQPTAVPTNITGKWETTTETSSMDDSQTVVLKLAAESFIQGWLDKFLPVLIIRCKEHKIEVYIHIGTQSEVEYGSDLSTVRVRLDANPALTIKMSHSTDGNALFFPEPEKMVSTLNGRETMLFEFTPFNAPPDETSFNLRGISEAIKPLRDACPNQ
jgi:type VI secretion system protein VasI